MPERRIAGIILAAGRSSRMGRTKQLLKFAGEPLLNHSVRTAFSAGLEPVHVVLGHDAEAVAEVCDFSGATTVTAPEWSAGQAASLRAGISSLPDDVTGAVILLGDMPLVTPGTVRAVADAIGDDAVVPAVNGRRGNPAGIGRKLFPLLLELDGDAGARQIFEAHPPRVVAVSDIGIFRDVDTPEDHAALVEEQAEPGKTGGTDDRTSAMALQPVGQLQTGEY